MADETHGTAAGTAGVAQDHGAHAGMIGRAFGWAKGHPKTTMFLGAGISLFAGAELLAAGLIGGLAATIAGVGRKLDPK